MFDAWTIAQGISEIVFEIPPQCNPSHEVYSQLDDFSQVHRSLASLTVFTTPKLAIMCKIYDVDANKSSSLWKRRKNHKLELFKMPERSLRHDH